MITYFFKTYGCSANVADSEGLAKYLDDLGCQSADAEQHADLIIINTCAVREKAEQKVWSYLGRLHPMKLSRPYIKIGIIGCVASYKKQEIYDRFDYVSFVYGAREELPALQVYLADLVTQMETTKQVFYNKENPGFTPEEKTAMRELILGQDRDVTHVAEKIRLMLPSNRSHPSIRFAAQNTQGDRGLGAAVIPGLTRDPEQITRAFNVGLDPRLRGDDVKLDDESNEQNSNASALQGESRLTVRVSSVIPAKAGIQSPELNRSMINIMTGCNKYCTYCIVPFTRGRETSFAMSAILDRVQRDVAAGAKEVTLIGQNVNSYKDPETGALFPELLQRVAEIEGTFWVRFMSPHPQDMTIDLFDVMAAHRNKVPTYIHFPLQSGSNQILKAMNRTYTCEEYLEKIDWIRDRLPGAAISTDLIVGFPGETEEDFLATMHAIELIQYDLIYSFIYSRRKYTKAWQLSDDCAYDVKQTRLDILQKRQMEIAAQRNALHIDKTLICLVEKRLGHGKLLARTEGNIRVVFDGTDDMINTFVRLLIKTAGPAQMQAMFVLAA